MKTRLILFATLLLGTHLLLAQRTPYTTFYRYNWQAVNPAAMDRIFMVDPTKSLMVSSYYHQQWIGVEGAPVFYHVSVEHKPIVDQTFPHQIKWGFQAFGDVTDAIGSFGLYGNFSYYIKLQNRRGRFLHFGVSPGLIQYRVDADKTRFKDDEPLLGAFEEGQLYADFSFGIFYRESRKFYFGLSVPQTFTLNLNSQVEDGIFVAERLRNLHAYFVIGGFLTNRRINYRAKKVVVEPSLWVRYIPGLTYQTYIEDFPISADLNLRLHYRNFLWGAVGFGTAQNLHLEFGIYKPIVPTYGDPGGLMRIGLSYDAPLGGKEVQLGHNLGITAAFAWN